MVTNFSAGAHSDSPEAIYDEADRLQRQGNHKESVKLCERLFKMAPDHPQVLNMYAFSIAQLGDLSKAREMLEKAIKIDPDYPQGWANLGVVLNMCGDHEAAAQIGDQYRKRNPDSEIGHMGFANACHDLERFGEALAAYEQALAITPENPLLWSNLSRVCLFEGEWKKALEAADQALTHYPGNPKLLAYKSTAMTELGQRDEVAKLFDFDRLVEVKEFSAPEGYADLNSFNDAVCAHSLDHPSLTYEPGIKSTVKGHQTTDFSEDKDQGPIAPLLEMIDGAVREYQKTHPIDATHPFLAQLPDSWDYSIWATVLGSQGHQKPHYYTVGWLSGVYYAKIPDVITADTETKAGWIELGRVQEYPKSKAEPLVRSYQPYEGMVILFPSFIYHRTEPFESEDKRISIAFDIRPHL